MARNRVIYNSEALFAGQKAGKACYEQDEGVNSIKQLHRVQNANYAFNVARTDINQFGELAAIDRIISDTPTVSLDFSYYLANFSNEHFLGLNIGNTGNGSVDPFGDGEGLTTAVKFYLDSTKDQRNYFIQTSAEGIDAINDEDNRNKGIIGIGNGFITSYSVDAAVGGLPTASIGVEALNMSFESGMVLRHSGFGTSDYVDSWRSRGSGADGALGGASAKSSGVPILYDGKGQKLVFSTGVGGLGQHHTWSGFHPLKGNNDEANSFLWRNSGVRLPSINPVDGTKSNGAFFLPNASGHAGADASGILNLSTLRPGDIRLYFRQVRRGSGPALSGFSGAGSSAGEAGFKDPDIPGIELPTQSGYKREAADDADNEVTASHIQSFTLGFDLSRTPLQRLGVKHAFSREIDFPVNVTFSIDAILADITTGNLADIIDCDRSYDVAVEMCAPADCFNTAASSHDLRSFDTRIPVATYIIKNAKLDSESFTSSIGDNKGVTLDFSAQIGGPNQSGNGLFMKGVTTANMDSVLETSAPPFPHEALVLT
jgi:hypothetical protein